jgi:hypothetical protein
MFVLLVEVTKLQQLDFYVRSSRRSFRAQGAGACRASTWTREGSTAARLRIKAVCGGAGGGTCNIEVLAPWSQAPPQRRGAPVRVKVKTEATACPADPQTHWISLYQIVLKADVDGRNAT